MNVSLQTSEHSMRYNAPSVFKIESDGRFCFLELTITENKEIFIVRGANSELRAMGWESALPLMQINASSFHEVEVNERYALKVGEPIWIRNNRNDATFFVRIIGVDDSELGGVVVRCEYRMFPAYIVYSDSKEVSEHFVTRARLIRQLGEQLVKTPSVALLELVKNAYDADATMCEIEMAYPRDKERGTITILDDGCGMTREIITDAWLQIGTSFKSEAPSGMTNYRTAKFRRVRMGEKGIGRFGVHRLGDRIEVVTRSLESKYEYVITVDWRDIDNIHAVEDLPVTVTEREPVTFVLSSGTRIRVSKLRSEWDKTAVQELARSVATLNSPFDPMDGFKAFFTVVGDKDVSGWLASPTKLEDVEDQALFKFDIVLQGNRIKNFRYDFCPWINMSKLKSRHIEWGDSNVLSRMVLPSKNSTPINIEELGEVRFKGVVFDQDPRVLSLGAVEKKDLKAYLKTNCGVRVFRDNMRVLDYGEPGNDWLGLNARRANRMASHIGNSIILGAVYLNGETRHVLPEKANREGFIENDVFSRLKDAILFCMSRVDAEWEADKRLISKCYGPTRSVDRIPVQSPIMELKEKIGSIDGLVDSDRKFIMACVDKIQSDYETIVDNLIKSAGAGLNLIMVLHQMEKLVRNMTRMLDKTSGVDNLRGQLKMLDDLIEGYTVLIRKSDKKIINLASIIRQALFNVSFRFESHQISVERAFESRESSDAYAAKAHVLNSLMNLFDNSIWWMGYSRTPEKSLYIDLMVKTEGFVDLVVADNGPGFTKPTSEIVRPFVTDKPGGMGIGLHLTDEAMKSLGGRLLFPDPVSYGLPKKYCSGATVVLRFATKETLK